MQNNENPQFFDKKTIIAIVLVGAVWIGWQKYLTHKYPQQPAQVPAETQANQNPTDTTTAITADSSNPKTQATSVSANVEQNKLVEEKTVKYINKNFSFDISSYGMGIKNIELNSYKDRGGQSIKIGHVPSGEIENLSTNINYESAKIIFDITQQSDNLYVGKAQYQDVLITKEMEIKPETYQINYKIRVENPSKKAIQIQTYLGEEKKKIESSFLLPTLEKQEFVFKNSEGNKRVLVSKKDERINETHTNVYLASIDSQYFAMATIDRSDVLPEIRINSEINAKEAKVIVNYNPPTPKELHEFSYIAYVGPKQMDILSSVDPELGALIDFGFFSQIAKQLLGALKWFYNFAQNWGLAIILLTLLVRALVLPLYFMSFKSMKAMQKIQPQMQAIREKYKNDPQTMNKEIMTIMKDNKVSPFGGCLPMLLQLPIFIALYQVFGNSIELYQAPFFAWITDLSLKDPYYILPVLMAVAMFVQQKLTPTTADPVQAKVMLFMPVMFSLFMLALPSSLTLYIFVSTLFGVVQQVVFMREKSLVKN